MTSYFGALFSDKEGVYSALKLLARRAKKILLIPRYDVSGGHLCILPESLREYMDGLGVPYRKLTAEEAHRALPERDRERLPEIIQNINKSIDPAHEIGFDM